MERRVRLVTGLTLFAYAASHFLGHATGIFGLAAMEYVGRGIVLAPWRTPVGRAALIVSLFIHGALGLYALYRRRHLRVPTIEAWQLALGLAIPLLLAPHFMSVRIGADSFGLADAYPEVLHRIWMGATRLVQDLLLLALVWTHGCIGLYFWVRRYETYRRWRSLLLACAVAFPFLAALGVVNAGWQSVIAAGSQLDPAGARVSPASGVTPPDAEATLDRLARRLQIGYGGLLLLTLAARLVRDRLERGPKSVRVSYPPDRVVASPPGFSILETSRWAGIPHASACGGRGRCSTCRVQILSGAEALPEPSDMERETLKRVNAPPLVRLACQLRPVADVSVALLVPAAEKSRGAPAVSRETHEMLVTALFIDLRDSTRLAAGRMPFDALYIVDRYVQRVTEAIEAHGGVVTTVAGDGVMSVFGAKTDPLTGARGALRAIGAVWDAIEALSRDLAGELDTPLAFGAGLHSSVAAVTSTNAFGSASVQILGDAGNIASRLEAATKVLNAVCVVSEAVFKVAGVAAPVHLAREELKIRGLEGRAMPVVLARHREDARFDEALV
jgi:adenylate cyclase